MAGEIQFQEPGQEYEYKHKQSIKESSQPKLIRWVIKYSGGLIKTEEQALFVLLGFVVVMIIISLFLVFGGGHEKQSLEKQFPPGSSALEE